MRLFLKKKKLLFYIFILSIICFITLNLNVAVKQFNNSNQLLNSLNKKLKHILNNSLIKNQKNNDSQNFQQNHLLSNTLTSNRTRFLVYDTGGFERVTSQLIECSNDNIDIEITGSVNDISKADICVFHMEVSSLNVNTLTNKRQYKMVYSMESEVNLILLFNHNLSSCVIISFFELN